MLDKFFSSLMQDSGISHIYVIGIGEKKGENSNDYKNIRKAQAKLCDERDDCTVVAGFIGKESMMKDEYHYTQEGYNLVGRIAGGFVGKIHSGM